MIKIIFLGPFMPSQTGQKSKVKYFINFHISSIDLVNSTKNAVIFKILAVLQCLVNIPRLRDFYFFFIFTFTRQKTRLFGVAQNFRHRQHSELDICILRQLSPGFYLLEQSCWVLRSYSENIFWVHGVADVFFGIFVWLLQTKNSSKNSISKLWDLMET